MGQIITILTDCARVLRLDRWNAVNARQRRWSAYLMQFNLCVKFVKCCRNYAADALPRIFEDFTAEQKLEFAPDCSSNDEFIVSVGDSSNDISTDGQTQTDEIIGNIAFLCGLEQQYHNFRGSKSPKTAKRGPNRHFPAKMPKSYNGNISKIVSPIKLKFKVQLGTTRY